MRHEHGRLGTADGTRLFWQAWHPDEATSPAVVLVHGAGEHGGRYAHVAAQLTESGHPVYACDHRGHGRSDGPRAAIGRMATLVADLRRFIGLLDGRPFLVGHSLGGAVALNYAIEHGDTIEGLVLSAPAVATEAVPAPLKAIVATLSRLAPRVPAFQIDAELISRDADVVADYRTDPLNWTGMLPARTLGELLHNMDTIPGRVVGLKVPVLLMHGSEDALCPPAGSRMVHDGAGSRDKTLKLYDGLFHEIFNEPEREQVVRDLAAWLAQRSREPVGVT
jgi:alpha-beta hydrolase superfamily lysophospholipase